MKYLEGLNAAQKQAVLHREGPLLIVAGAGAGKTKTITHRIAHLIESGVPAHRILAVTFTNKAAGEMRERVKKLLGTAREAQGKPLLLTFHSLGVRILREFHEAAGVPRSFSIWDRDDSMKALKRILSELGSDMTPKSALAAISRQKGDGISGSEFAAAASDYRSRALVRAWDEYEKTLQKEGALDFDDLLLRTLLLLRNTKDVLAKLQDRWTHITIDEYQDTNRSQYELARLLAGERRNLCVVGDTDQNIYSWRGADIEHLLGFEKAFPGATVVTLEENYRSTRTILAAANSVIEKNTRRTPKILRTENPTGEPIFFYGAQNEVDEAWFVAQTAAHLIEKGTRASKIAVLYRENFQSRVLEEAFLHIGVPYRVLGTRFFERKEVKDVLAYLRAAINPAGTTDIARIIAVPPRGIGKITLEKMLAGNENGVPASARAKIASFKDTLIAIRQAIHTAPASEAVRFTLEASGMEAMFKKDPLEGEERLGNVYELVNLTTKYDHMLSPEGIERLLEEAALQSEQDQLDIETERRDRTDGVTLMTVHASKGLEFDAVFVTGLEQGLFPWVKDDDRDPEEERRLFYVAVTRAAKRLFLSYARERMKYGSREHTIPSEFLEDIDARLMTSGAAEEERVID